MEDRVHPHVHHSEFFLPLHVLYWCNLLLYPCEFYLQVGPYNRRAKNLLLIFCEKIVFLKIYLNNKKRKPSTSKMWLCQRCDLSPLFKTDKRTVYLLGFPNQRLQKLVKNRSLDEKSGSAKTYFSYSIWSNNDYLSPLRRYASTVTLIKKTRIDYWCNGFR